MMTSLDFYFDQATLDRANTYKNAGNYPAMYQTLSDAVSVGGGDARLANGLKNAGDIYSAQRRDAPSIRTVMDQADHKVNKIKTQHHPAAV
ncbi:hypothetical protein D1605_007620 [Xylella fastidiosa subsp. fastidiosa]|uniref:RTX toxin Ca2+-binding protein n=4 Tax=Xylella fastidiosa TaxID=2371 RepID=Q87BM5_XYLFT|nr:hypothetical protein [Xylella fastidiosa]ADN62269.1 hypothetical protein XFLM_01285 [Xylella fastidiosa subsp. fastidiosa GB514]KAF0571695.1 RTX toxin Ca2+-binding protein [Xylella fastidiosa subsp. fastidiosa Mus-1]AAO29270.1 conserved hypothetical protein [Xylella fastidiosa Temecula1]ACB92918.1 hypothetical protein XfasM23_1508 [Xylella fastidiosa M23]KGM20140.1 RTX toxin Ca2+-binding protein [Xylella fastidiosa]